MNIFYKVETLQTKLQANSNHIHISITNNIRQYLYPTTKYQREIKTLNGYFAYSRSKNKIDSLKKIMEEDCVTNERMNRAEEKSVRRIECAILYIKINSDGHKLKIDRDTM